MCSVPVIIAGHMARPDSSASVFGAWASAPGQSHRVYVWEVGIACPVIQNVVGYLPNAGLACKIGLGGVWRP